jgi:hypothetical protein
VDVVETADASMPKKSSMQVGPGRWAAKRAASKGPKADAEVVAALQKKILVKCRSQGDTKVRIEGLISSEGRAQGILVSPTTEAGGCAKKIVSAERFDPKAGARPLPRFTVEL